jgi:hypothetical protein
MVRQQCYFVGLDLGQAQDFTALAVLERPLVCRGDPRALRRPAYALRHLRRFPLGTPYPEVIEAVVRLLRTPPLAGTVLGVDQTGVGRAVVDLIADGLRGRVTCTFCPVTLTSCPAVPAGDGLCVPRKELVGVLQVLLQTRRLQVARTLPEAPLLVRELETFKAKVAVARDGAPEAWREGANDDLVLALAAWLGEQALPTLADPSNEETCNVISVP